MGALINLKVLTNYSCFPYQFVQIHLRRQLKDVLQKNNQHPSRHWCFLPVTLSSPDLHWMHPNTPDFLVSFLISQLLINQMLILIGNIFSLIWKIIEKYLIQASPSVLSKKTKLLFQKQNHIKLTDLLM